MSKKERGPSRAPQKISDNIWYYESNTAIQVYLSAAFVRGNPTNGVNFRIAKRKLKASLRRMDEHSAQRK